MGQKSWYKASQSGTYVQRNTFPQIPGTQMKNPKTLQTKRGKLLLSGCWGVVRKPSASLLAPGPFGQWLNERARRLHVGLDPGDVLGSVGGVREQDPLLLPAVPPHDAHSSERARQRKVHFLAVRF